MTSYRRIPRKPLFSGSWGHRSRISLLFTYHLLIFLEHVHLKHHLMTVAILKRLFQRDLGILSKEIGLYRQEKNLWITDGQIANSAGNLCLHLVGNLNTYIGAAIGNTGYIRDRDLEFADKNVPRTTLLRLVADTLVMIDTVLGYLSDDMLADEYPMQVFETRESYGYFLTHLCTHLNYHLGQVNYHRRLLDT